MSFFFLFFPFLRPPNCILLYKYLVLSGLRLDLNFVNENRAKKTRKRIRGHYFRCEPYNVATTDW